MKKTICVLALAALSAAALSAREVLPINVTLTDLKLDSLRTVLADSLDVYQSKLEVLEKALKTDKGEIDMAKKQLKSEQSYAKSQEKLHKQKEKNFKEQSKALDKQEKTNKKERKDIEKLRKAYLKDKKLDQRTVSAYVHDLDGRATRLDQADRNIAAKRMDLQKEWEVLKNDMIELTDFNHALKNKESELKNMEQRNKLDTNSVKNEKKIVSGRIKEQKKAQAAAK